MCLLYHVFNQTASKYIPAGTTVTLGSIGTEKDDIKSISDIEFKETWLSFIRRLLILQPLPKLTDTRKLQLQEIMDVIDNAASEKPSIEAYSIVILIDQNYNVKFQVTTEGKEWQVLPKADGLL